MKSRVILLCKKWRENSGVKLNGTLYFFPSYCFPGHRNPSTFIVKNFEDTGSKNKNERVVSHASCSDQSMHMRGPVNI